LIGELDSDSSLRKEAALSQMFNVLQLPKAWRTRAMNKVRTK